MEEKVVIYSDGACSGNPGIGGWGAVLVYGNHKKTISGVDKNTTNNRMEIKAVLMAFKELKRKCDVLIYTDSKYLKDGITIWCENWQKNNWKTSKKEDVKNRELWEELLSFTCKHKVEWRWVKGHSDNKLNNEADFLATEAIKKFKAGEVKS